MKTFQLFLLAGLLAFALFLNGCNDATEPSEPEEPKPTEVSVGNVYQGSIDKVGEIDLYLLKPTKDYYIHFVCTEAIASSDFNPDIAVFDDERNAQLGSKQDYSTAVVTNLMVQAGKRYKIQVREWSDDRTGAYTLKLQEDLDDGNTLIEGQEITGEIEYVEDYDEFIVSITNSGFYHMVAREFAVQSEYNPDISLIDFATKSVIASHQSYTEATIVNKKLEQGFKYILRVREWSDDRAGKYFVKYEKDLDDEIHITSTPFTYQGKIQYVGDSDKLYFSPSIGGIFRITLAEKFINSNYNPAIEIYDQFNNHLGSATAYDICVIENLNLNSNSVYTINVHEWSDDETGDYIFTIERQ